MNYETVKVEMLDLFAVGRFDTYYNSWILLDYFNSEVKAKNSKNRCLKNLERIGDNTKIESFKFLPNENKWVII